MGGGWLIGPRPRQGLAYLFPLWGAFCPMRPEMTEWNPDVDALARKMWVDGLPASKIADAIGRSRNSVIARANRQNWGNRKVAVPRKPKFSATQSRPPAPSGPKPLRRPPPAPPIFDQTKVEFTQATSQQCKFILNNSAPWFACGAAIMPSLPYCEYHCQICYGRQGTRARSSPSMSEALTCLASARSAGPRAIAIARYGAEA